MTPSRPALPAALLALLLGAGLVTAGPANAERDGDGRGPEAGARVADRGFTARAVRAAAADDLDPGEAAPPLELPTSYPSQPQLRIYPDNQPDASDAAGLLGHDDLAPLLMDWEKTSNRISAQVVGESTQGRDLYLVTVTAPETEAQTTQQTAWREEIRDDPEGAATDDALAAGYKAPIWMSANIHGNEWEGTDAAMRTIHRLVTAPWADVKGLLRENRLYFSLTLNPDGRTAGDRYTALGLDENRDMITNATPESRSFVRTAQAIQPLYAADFHGYADVLQVEPCGPPHGENYEYDLYLPQNYAMVRAVERSVVRADIPGNTYYDIKTGDVVKRNTSRATSHIRIPYRDTPSGWDDYPPIFTAQYTAFYGAATSTVELPLARPSYSAQSPSNAKVNRAVAVRTMSTMLRYFDAHADDLLADQIGVFTRGVEGEPKDSLTADEIDDVPGPGGWQQHWDVADDQDPVTLPRAYVIPVGDDQRSASDATRLVEQLLFHQVDVATLDADTVVDGTTYPAGSYVVDMHQPLRGLANTLLDLGTDISAKVPSMYDISAWSLSYLWGATVDKVGLTTDAPIGATTPVTAPTSNAAVPASGTELTFDLAGVADYRALNDLLDAEVPVAMPESGVGVVTVDDAGDRAAVEQVADDEDIAFRAATPAEVAALDDDSTRTLHHLRIAYAGTQDDALALSELGFRDLVPVTARQVTQDPSLVTDADLLWVGTGFDLPEGAARDAVQDWVDDGHAIVGRMAKALTVTSSFGLASAGEVGRGPTLANGIVALDTPSGSPLAPYAQDSAFVYPATWFSDLGPGTTAAQTYGDPSFLAGHWRDEGGGRGSQADAAGEASVIAGEAASGARSVVFGTWVFFRTHPKGGMSQAARAIFWAAPEQ